MHKLIKLPPYLTTMEALAFFNELPDSPGGSKALHRALLNAALLEFHPDDFSRLEVRMQTDLTHGHLMDRWRSTVPKVTRLPDRPVCVMLPGVEQRLTTLLTAPALPYVYDELYEESPYEHGSTEGPRNRVCMPLAVVAAKRDVWLARMLVHWDEPDWLADSTIRVAHVAQNGKYVDGGGSLSTGYWCRLVNRVLGYARERSVQLNRTLPYTHAVKLLGEAPANPYHRIPRRAEAEEPRFHGPGTMRVSLRRGTLPMPEGERLYAMRRGRVIVRDKHGIDPWAKALMGVCGVEYQEGEWMVLSARWLPK